VFASDLNPVAVVTMKAAIEFPLKFGAALQEDIDKWVKWVGDEAEKRLSEFFPSQDGEKVQNYLWAHTVVCPNCQSIVPLSPNWWLDRSPSAIKKDGICAVKPIPNLTEKRVDFELIKGKKGKGNSIQINDGDYYPDDHSTISRGVGKCPNCDAVLEEIIIKKQAQNEGLGHQLYAIVFKEGSSNLNFRIPNIIDLGDVEKANYYLEKSRIKFEDLGCLPHQEIPSNTHRGPDMYLYGIHYWHQMFNHRQLLTLVTYVEIINEAKQKIGEKLGEEKLQAIATYLALVLDRCVDKNCRLARWHSSRTNVEACSSQHSLNLMWNYPELVPIRLWEWCAETVAGDYKELCDYLSTKINSSSFQELETHTEKIFQIDLASADSLFHLADQSLDSIVTDPPYYDSIRYGELSDFFYVWLYTSLKDIFPELFITELTDKDREAIANQGRFRDMGISPKELADQDYEAKMSMAFAEYHRVLRDDGVMTVQFNHKESGAWDVLAKSLMGASQLGAEYKCL
jgi:adenine-specific DNA methylase